jgi:hypothetical protein
LKAKLVSRGSQELEVFVTATSTRPVEAVTPA